MVFINGNKLSTYYLDTADTIINRIAQYMNTLPKYLYFPDYFPKHPTYNDLISGNNIRVEDVLNIVIQDSENNIYLFDVIDKITNKITKRINIKTDIIPIWIAYNTTLQKQYDISREEALNTISDEIVKSKMMFNRAEFDKVWKNRDKTRRLLIEDKQSLSKRNIFEIDRFQRLREIDDIDIKPSTDLEIEKIKFEVILDTQQITLLELFNQIVLNMEVPFATTRNFYKIINDFVPPREWAVEDSSIHIKVSQREDVLKTKTDEYSTVVVNVSDKEVVTATFSVNIGSNYIKRDMFIERFLSIFKDIDIKVGNIKENQVVGVFYFPQYNINKYVFSDLVMNDKIFSKLININESKKATKKKTELYIYLNHPMLSYNMTATITTKIWSKKDPTIRYLNENDFIPEDKDEIPFYVRIRVTNAENIKIINIFRELLGRLFYIYDDSYNDIVDIYKQFLTNDQFIDAFAVIKPDEKEKTKLKLKERVPELFVSLYSRQCTHMPCITSNQKYIDDMEEEEEKTNVMKIMKFPRDKKEYLDKLPTDGENQQYYTCECKTHKTHKFIGLKENKLSNNDIFPYIPCCFEKNRKESDIVKAYYDENFKIKKQKYLSVIKTNKILKHDQFGYLPKQLNDFFSLVNPDPRYEYIRKGVHKTEDSFIEAVMEAVEEIDQDRDDEDERLLDLIDVRNQLATETNASLCRQEMYDKSTEEIIKIIESEDYFDPKLFIHLLEKRFKCNIFLFSNRGNTSEMILPKHLQTYYKFRRNIRCIYIYEHKGSEVDRSKYPQCELIVKHRKVKDSSTEYIFSYNEATVTRQMYEKLKKSFVLNSEIRDVVMPWNKKVKIISQQIDTYGKTRKLNIQFQGSNLSILTSPIQPVEAKESTDDTIYNGDIKILLELVKILKIKLISQNVLKKTLKQLNGVLGNVTVHIPVTDSLPIKDLPITETSLEYPREKVSTLDIYNKNKKIARYLVEYVYWLYSKYINKKNTLNMDENSITAFVKKRIRVIPDHNYGNDPIPKTFSMYSPVMQNKKLVITTEETLKRLLYVLRIAIIRNRHMIKNYHRRRVIINYYLEIIDFDKYKSQVILYGEESIEKWINQRNMTYYMYNEVLFDVNNPYFFKNNAIGRNVFLAQNTDTLNKAMDIAIKWREDRYNPGIYAENISSVPFTLYVYRNSENIEKLKVDGGDSNIKILGYKKNNVPLYTVLLTLN